MDEPRGCRRGLVLPADGARVRTPGQWSENLTGTLTHTATGSPAVRAGLKIHCWMAPAAAKSSIGIELDARFPHLSACTHVGEHDDGALHSSLARWIRVARSDSQERFGQLFDIDVLPRIGLTLRLPVREAIARVGRAGRQPDRRLRVRGSLRGQDPDCRDRGRPERRVIHAAPRDVATVPAPRYAPHDARVRQECPKPGVLSQVHGDVAREDGVLQAGELRGATAAATDQQRCRNEAAHGATVHAEISGSGKGGAAIVEPAGRPTKGLSGWYDSADAKAPPERRVGFRSR